MMKRFLAVSLMALALVGCSKEPPSVQVKLDQDDFAKAVWNFYSAMNEEQIRAKDGFQDPVFKDQGFGSSSTNLYHLWQLEDLEGNATAEKAVLSVVPPPIREQEFVHPYYTGEIRFTRTSYHIPPGQKRESVWQAYKGRQYFTYAKGVLYPDTTIEKQDDEIVLVPRVMEEVPLEPEKIHRSVGRSGE